MAVDAGLMQPNCGLGCPCCMHGSKEKNEFEHNAADANEDGDGDDVRRRRR